MPALITLWQHRPSLDLRRAHARGETEQAFAAFRRRSYFPALDGLRALSIALVLFHHSGMTSDDGLRQLLPTLNENGRYGVGCFFLISGFLICTLLLREQAQHGQINLWRFYGRRALRLLPLYYAALLLACFLVFGLHEYSAANRELFRQKLFSYLFYYSNWLPTASQGPFFCAWSLAVEEQFYLVFALALWLLPRRAVVKLVAAALAVKVAVYLTFGAVDVQSTLWRVLLSYREPVLMGVLLGFALHTRRGFELANRWLGRGWVTAGAAVAAMVWLVGHRMKQESAIDAQLLYVLMAIVLGGLVLRDRVPIVSGKALTHVGKISYGIYLLHVFVFSVVLRFSARLGPAGAFLLACGLTILVASVVYHYFERPIIGFYKQRLGADGRHRLIPEVFEYEARPIPIQYVGAPGLLRMNNPALAVPSLEAPDERSSPRP